MSSGQAPQEYRQRGMSEPPAETSGMVAVRYVGPLHSKRDNLLNVKGREWPGTGSVLVVPASHAQAYLKHPGVWRRADEPWARPVARLRMSAMDIVGAMRAGDWGRIQHYEPDLYSGIAERFGGAGAPAPALHSDDAARLQAFVPELASALVHGPVKVVQPALEKAAPLLRAFPPLLEGAIAAERAAAGREMVLAQLEDLRANLGVPHPQQGLPLNPCDANEGVEPGDAA